MSRQFLTSIAVVGVLAVVACAAKAQEPKAKKEDLSKFNQVYVKVILPAESGDRDKDRPVVESWIAEDLKKRKQSKFTAATGWVPIAFTGQKFEVPTDVWGGQLGDEHWGCPTHGSIVERKDGRVAVRLLGWGPDGAEVTVSLKDEPGSREIAAVKEHKLEQGSPYVAVLIGPPAEKPSVPDANKK